MLNITWKSEECRKQWESTIRKIRGAWKEIEWRSVLRSVRCCCLFPLSQEEFSNYSLKFSKAGLNYLPIKVQKIQPDSYSNKLEVPSPGDIIGYRVVIGSKKSISDFIEAWNKNDHIQIGRLLGYPSCCCSFFKEIWIDREIIDTTWHTALNTKNKILDQSSIKIVATPQNNILGRWMGIRAVPHLPCSFDCKETLHLANNLIEVGCELGFHNEMSFLQEILSRHIEWTSQNGLAEIENEYFHIATSSDYSESRLFVSIN